MITPSDLLDREARLCADVAAHKTAIRQHRQQLGITAAELAHVRAECRRFGIGFREEHTNGTDRTGAASDHT